MFNDTGKGETQHCPMCLEWSKKYEKLKEEYNEIYDYLQEREKLINEHIIEVCQFDKYKREIEEKLNWVKECVSNYLSNETLDNMYPEYYKEWMLNVRNKVISKLGEPNDSVPDRIIMPGTAVEISDYHSRDNK